VLCQLETRAVAVAVLLMVLLTKMQKVNTTRSCHLAAEAAGLATTMGSDKGQIAALCLVHHGAGLSQSWKPPLLPLAAAAAGFATLHCVTLGICAALWLLLRCQAAQRRRAAEAASPLEEVSCQRGAEGR